MPVLSLMGMAFGVAATLLWVAFLLLLGWSLYVLFATGIWPVPPLNSYLDRPFADPYGSAWVGWYILGGTIFAMLASLGCTSARRK